MDLGYCAVSLTHGHPALCVQISPISRVVDLAGKNTELQKKGTQQQVNFEFLIIMSNSLA